MNPTKLLATSLLCLSILIVPQHSTLAATTTKAAAASAAATKAARIKFLQQDIAKIKIQINANKLRIAMYERCALMTSSTVMKCCYYGEAGVFARINVNLALLWVKDQNEINSLQHK